MLCMTTVVHGQQALTELTKQAYAYPLSDANQGLISMIDRMQQDEVSLLLCEDWQPLDLVADDGTQLSIDSANYHIELDQILFIRNGEMFTLFTDRVTHIRMGDRRFVYLPFQEKKKKGRAHFEVLADGDLALLKRHEMTQKTTYSHPMGIPATRQVEVQQDAALFYKTSGSRYARPLPRKKREVLMIFRRNRGDMMQYAVEQKLSPRAEQDMQELVAYYNAVER